MTEISWQRICCPVDYSERSRAALRVAVDLARRFGAELTLLHVEEAAHAGDGAKLEEWKSEAIAAGVRVVAAIVSGDPQTAIAQYANDHTSTRSSWARTDGRDGRTRSSGRSRRPPFGARAAR